MKLSIKLMTVLLAFSLLFFGCAPASDDEDAGISAPEMPAVADIPSSGATAAPATEAEAETIYSDALAALNTLVEANDSVRSIRAPRTTETVNEPINVNFTVGAGTVVYTGLITGSSTYPDDDMQMELNKTYNDIVSVVMNGTVNGTLTNVEVTYGGNTYIINGTAKNQIDESFNMDIVTGSDPQGADMQMNLDFSFGLGIGTALSIRNKATGVGAKFVITYAANYGRNNLDLTDESSTEAFSTEMEEYLMNQQATLTVYDDTTNEMILTTKLSADDAFETSILSGL